MISRGDVLTRVAAALALLGFVCAAPLTVNAQEKAAETTEAERAEIVDVKVESDEAGEGVSEQDVSFESFKGFGENAPPGLDRPFNTYPDRQRELVRPFGDELEESPGEPFTPLNEFAGQTQRYEPGVIGDALGKMKRSIIGSFSKP
nr:hypothetical protein [Paracoccaceae bacterium]